MTRCNLQAKGHRGMAEIVSSYGRGAFLSPDSGTRSRKNERAESRRNTKHMTRMQEALHTCVKPTCRKQQARSSSAGTHVDRGARRQRPHRPPQILHESEHSPGRHIFGGQSVAAPLALFLPNRARNRAAGRLADWYSRGLVRCTCA